MQPIDYGSSQLNDLVIQGGRFKSRSRADFLNGLNVKANYFTEQHM